VPPSVERAVREASDALQGTALSLRRPRPRPTAPPLPGPGPWGQAQLIGTAIHEKAATRGGAAGGPLPLPSSTVLFHSPPSLSLSVGIPPSGGPPAPASVLVWCAGHVPAYAPAQAAAVVCLSTPTLSSLSTAHSPPAARPLVGAAQPEGPDRPPRGPVAGRRRRRRRPRRLRRPRRQRHQRPTDGPKVRGPGG